MKIVFMGTDDFGLPALEALKKAGHAISAIVSTPPRPKGRGRKLADSPVSEYAKKQNYSPVFLPEKLKEPEFIHKLEKIGADLYLVAAFRILPYEVFSIPRLGTINIHASILPKYRGPAPIQRAIEAGEKATGVTIFVIDKGIDTGKIILQKQAEIGPAETTPELYEKLSRLGAQAAVDAVAMLESGNIDYIPQDEACATKAPKLAKQEALISWSDTANQIFNRIRAFKPFPSTYTLCGEKRLGIERAEFSERTTDASPGTIVAKTDDWFEVQCGTGILRVTEVKPEGKNSMQCAA